MTALFTIGKLARAAQVSVETIRYYQRRGLLAVPSKPLGGQRRYSEDSIRRLRFIRRAQGLGFTLDEIAALLSLDRARACAPTHALATRKRALIHQKVSDLTALQAALDELIERCHAYHSTSGCPIIDALARD